ncbi:MAG: S26 family signal peptidase [Parvularculaceae bacterium]
MKSCRLLPMTAGAVSIAVLGLAMDHEFTPRFVWNASASAPIGLYAIKVGTRPRIGDFVLVEPEPGLEGFITERGYLPPKIPLIKRVAALPGDEVCRQNQAILVAKIHVADALFMDSVGRKMPVWSGCFTLKSDEMFLLNPHEKSLDGRYFGATKSNDVVGVAVPIQVWKENR